MFISAGSHFWRNPHFAEMPTEPTVDPVPMPRAVRQVARHLRVGIFAEAAKNNLGWYNLACFRGYYPKFFGGDCDCSSFLMFGDVLGCVQVFLKVSQFHIFFGCLHCRPF